MPILASCRLSVPADFKEIMELRWLLKTEHLRPDEFSDREIFSNRYLRHLEEMHHGSETAHWVLEVDGAIQGVVTIRKVSKETSITGEAGVWGYLTNSFVRGEYRNKGLGTELMANAISWARREKLEFLIVWPSAKSRSFYCRAGFSGRDDPLVLYLE